MRLRIWRHFLVLVLLLVSLPVLEARPLTADDAMPGWRRLAMPEDGANGNWVIAYRGGAGTGVNRIAVGADGNTIYALDSNTPLLFKSTDSGYTWADITGRVSGFTSLDYLAVSPDDANFVAVVDARRPEVFLSLNGGASFMPTGAASLGASGTIGDIAVSRSFGTGGGTTRSLVLGTSTGAGGGQVWMMTLGTQFRSWTNVSTGAAGWTAADAFAVAFSPGYPADRTVLALAADNVTTPGDVGSAGTTRLNLGRVDLATLRVTWNAPLFSGYPVALATAGRDSPGTPLAYAGLALPLDYYSADASSRRVFISWSDGAGGNTSDDVYRLDDTTVVRLNAGNGSEFVGTSLAYHGTYERGKLLVGGVTVRLTLDPQSRLPTWQESRKPPTGAGDARVAWSADGKVAYSGTSGDAASDESAFSRSMDSGLSWSQTGLIDTRITKINDLQVAPDGSTLFVTTVNLGAPNADSLWRVSSTPLGKRWERVLARSSAGTGDNPLVRIDPDYRSTQALWYLNTDPLVAFQELFLSQDGGNTYSRGFPSLALVDLAAEDQETVYGVDAAGLVSKGTRGGRVWEPPVNTYLGTGYSIASARTTTTPDNDKGNIIVGGRGNGSYDVAYSTNGGTTFTPIVALLPTRGNTLAVASSDYRSDGTILAINSGGMYAGSIFSGKGEWEAWWGGASWPSPVTGLQISRNYGFYFSTPATAWSPATPYIRWSGANAGLDAGISLGTQPAKKMALSGGMASGEPVILWAIDQRPYSPPQGGIWYYADTLSWLGPTPVAPVNGAPVDYDPVSGRASQVTLRWESGSPAAGYEVQIALDEQFSTIVADIGGGWAGPFYYPPAAESPALVIPPGGGAVADARGNTWTVPALFAGKTYYWRVRVQNIISGDGIKSPWSWTEFFKVKLGAPVRAPSLLVK